MAPANLKAQKRTIIGKKTKSLRKQGSIPGVVYGHGIKSMPITINDKEFGKVYAKAGVSSLILLDIDGEQKNVLIHHPQVHPVTDKPIHVDFYQVSLTEKIKTEIPIHIIGVCLAVKDLGGNLILNRDAINVECLPADLIPHIEVDISPLKTFDDIIHIKDLNIPSAITVLEDMNESLVVVTAPRSEEELAALEEKVEEKIEEVAVETEEKAAERAAAKAEEAKEETTPKKESKKE